MIVYKVVSPDYHSCDTVGYLRKYYKIGSWTYANRYLWTHHNCGLFVFDTFEHAVLFSRIQHTCILECEAKGSKTTGINLLDAIERNSSMITKEYLPLAYYDYKDVSIDKYPLPAGTRLVWAVKPLRVV